MKFVELPKDQRVSDFTPEQEQVIVGRLTTRLVAAGHRFDAAGMSAGSVMFRDVLAEVRRES